MLARRSFSTVSRVLFTSNKAGATGSGGGGDKPKKSAKADKADKETTSQTSKAAQPKATPAAAAPAPKFSNDSYQAPEYFAHDKWSYANVIVDLASQRLPQKSNKVPST